MYLEYRLLDEKNDFPQIAYYPNISKEEVLLRFHCDYWVKDRIVYELKSTSSESHGYVIYVEPVPEQYEEDISYVFQPSWKGVKVEFRMYQEGVKEFPLIKEYIYSSPLDALLHLASDFYYLDGKEYLKTSAEIDENEKKYVYYAKPTE